MGRTDLSPLDSVSPSATSTIIEERIGQGEKYLDKEDVEELPIPQNDYDDYPDGGLRAWLIVLGASVDINTYSTIFDGLPFTRQCVVPLQHSDLSMPGACSNLTTKRIFYEIHHLRKWTLLLVVATFLVAECHTYWQFLLCQGFTVGLACGICFGPTLSVVGHWFKRRRGIALGLTAAGSSMGGTVFPIAARNLIILVGFPWTMRIMAFILLFTLGISNIVLDRRLPPKNVPGGLFNFKAFKLPAFSIYCLANTIAFLGIYTVLTFIDVSAIAVGISPDFSFYLVSLANAGSGVGRIVTGIVADKYGPINIITPMTIGTAIMTFAWPYARTKNSLIAVAIIYGFASSAYVSAFNMPLYSMGVIEDVGRRMGTVMVFAALGAVAGPPISGAINASTGSTKAVSYYAGSTILLAVILMLITRHLILKKIWGKF
ncbi:hypothetical protein NP233_g6743 [Leucocoprinus birnbaumii]|uniref:Major facilitator superfamily (MFS) profile domain-containing protein n=1 Tax=Leucocoprinus birnbaumii TaxID=56174 RepID=A0AAD5YTE4_9AGAR|nr:hypothetical protein NP233_g6743 [Leucocoprinus birnbaumii]